MPTRRCCCLPYPCELGTDNFDRADNPDPGPKWKIISGTGEIKSQHIEVDGIVATTICHPPTHTNGSYEALFDLVGLRTETLYKVRVGDPTSSPYSVQFEPSGMDTPGAAILVTVTGTTTETHSYVWNSGDSVSAKICYEPGALLKGSIGAPDVDACIPSGGAACYTSGGDDVGGFAWLKGHFDNWIYSETILDNFDCIPCGCFCFRRTGEAKEFSCYPEVLYLNLDVVLGVCPEFDGITITMTQGTASPGDGHPQKIRWFSDVLTCDGFNYTFVLECSTIVQDGTNWFQSLALRICDASYVGSTVLFQWAVPTDGGSTREADHGSSTCYPLSMVYPGLKVNSFFGQCPPPAAPGSFGYFLFCCTGSTGCDASPLDIQIEVTVTA